MDKNTPTNNLVTRDLKKKPIYREISIETGHPEIAVDNVSSKLEDMGYKVSRRNQSVRDDHIADGVKDYFEDVEAKRSEKSFRSNAKNYLIYAICGGILVLIFIYLSSKNSDFTWVTLITAIATIIFYILSRPKYKSDFIWMKIQAKVYPGTKSREIRDAGNIKAGQTKATSSVYVHSDAVFFIGGDSEIGIERVTEDIGTISKYMQKI